MRCNASAPELTIGIIDVGAAAFRSQAGTPDTNEVKMFARKVAARVERNALPEFIKIMEKEILPWLRKQEGFLDLIVLAMHGGQEVATISFWERESDAEGWASKGFPEAAKILDRLLEGRPYVKTFDVVSSTVHELSPIAGSSAEVRATI